MNNWEKIIEGYSKKPDNQTMKLITATVTSVTNDFYRADVRLITGQEISNLINQTPNKLHVGQNVEVGYRTTPEAGWIQIAHGEPDPMRQGGGGVQVENAVLYDAANLHEYTVDNELMTDISANTKLYYGATGRMIVAQGMLFYQGSYGLNDNNFTNALDDLLTENSAYIAPEYSGIISYRYTNNVAYRCETDVKVYLSEVQYPNSYDRVTTAFTLEVTQKETNLSTSTETTSTSTTNIGTQSSELSDITEYGLLLVSTTFGEHSSVTQLEPYIPNGYVGVNSTASGSGVMAMLVYKNNNASVDKWNARYDGTIRSSGGSRSYGYVKVGYLMPLSSNETILALGATKRTEPQGGGN